MVTFPAYVPAVGWKLPPPASAPLTTCTVPDVVGCAPYMVTLPEFETGVPVLIEPRLIAPGPIINKFPPKPDTPPEVVTLPTLIAPEPDAEPFAATATILPPTLCWKVAVVLIVTLLRLIEPPTD